MKSRKRNIFIFLIAGVLNLFFTARGEADEAKNLYRDARTGVEIACEVDKGMFPVDWYAPPISVKATPLDVPNIETALRILLNGLAKYPVKLMEKDLKKIYVVQRLSYYNIEVGGFGSQEQKRLYIRYLDRQADYSEAYVKAYFEGGLHHEFAHILLANHADKFSRQKWQALNPPGFHYGKGGLAVARKGYYSPEDPARYWNQGFANDYALADLDEDVASLCEFLFAGNPRFWQTVDGNAVLQKKVAMLVAFYHALDSEFTPAYFRRIGTASTASASDTLPLSIPLASYSPGDLVVFTEGGWITLPGSPSRLIRAYAGEAGIYPSGSSFVLNIGKDAKPSAASAAPSQSPPVPPPPDLPPSYSPFWTQATGWLIYPNTRGLQLKAGTLQLHYQPGDRLFFPYSGFFYLPGKGEPIRVATGHTETYPAGAVAIFNAPPRETVSSRSEPKRNTGLSDVVPPQMALQAGSHNADTQNPPSIGPLSKVVLPFVDIDAPQISVLVDGVKLSLVVDTGSPTSFLTESACRKLNKPVREENSVNKTFAARSLQLANWNIASPVFRVMPEEQALAYRDNSDGLLGMDVLHNVVVQWDFAQKQMTLVEKGAFNTTPYAEKGVCLPLQEIEIHPKGTTLTGYRYLVTAGVEGVQSPRLTFPMELDTGSWITALPASVAPDAKRLTTLHNYYGAAATGEYRPDLSRLPFLALNTLVVANPVVELGTPGSLFAGGLLGMDILRHFTVTMDFPNKKLYLASDARFQETRTWIGSGYNAAWKDREYTIYSVSSPSPASEAGLQEGDVIISMDHFSMATTSSEELRKARQQWAEGKTVVLTIKRKGEDKPREVKLKVRKLL